jgi:hypothetical protein
MTATTEACAVCVYHAPPAHNVVIGQIGAEPKPTGKDVIYPRASFGATCTTLDEAEARKV